MVLPILITLRSRACGTVATWLVGVAAAVLLWGDLAYLVRVATDLEPRIVSLPEVLCVTCACILPALAFPRLHSWERLSQRRQVRLTAAMLAAVPLAALGCTALLAHLVHDTVQLTPMQGVATSVALFGAVAHVGVTLVGRTVGSLVAVATYFATLFVQALLPSFPLPVTVPSVATVGAGAAALVGVAGLHYAYLGHRAGSRSD